MGEVELYDLLALADRRDDTECIELQLCVLDIEEVLDTLEVRDGLEG